MYLIENMIFSKESKELYRLQSDIYQSHSTHFLNVKIFGELRSAIYILYIFEKNRVILNIFERFVLD